MKEKIYPSVTVILLNWNGWKNTIECLESLYQIDYPNYTVIVVDNASHDQSVARLKSYCQGNLEFESQSFKYSHKKRPIKLLEYEYGHQEFIPLQTNQPTQDFLTPQNMVLIRNDKNYGFTKGNNIAMEYALRYQNPSHILLLNNDTVVNPTFLSKMMDLSRKNERIGFIGPKIYQYPISTNLIQYAGGKQDLWRFEPQPIGYGEPDQGQYDHNQRVDFISGACILARTTMIREIGLLDEEFFSYREENDWCRRGYQHGWFTCYSYQAVVWHKGQGSTRNQQPTILYYMTRNRFLFMKKHARRVQIIIFILIFVLFDSWYRTAASLFYHRQTRLVFCFWKAIKDGLKILRQ